MQLHNQLLSASTTFRYFVEAVPRLPEPHPVLLDKLSSEDQLLPRMLRVSDQNLSQTTVRRPCSESRYSALLAQTRGPQPAAVVTAATSAVLTSLHFHHIMSCEQEFIMLNNVVMPGHTAPGSSVLFICLRDQKHVTFPHWYMLLSGAKLDIRCIGVSFYSSHKPYFCQRNHWH